MPWHGELEQHHWKEQNLAQISVFTSICCYLLFPQRYNTTFLHRLKHILAYMNAEDLATL